MFRDYKHRGDEFVRAVTRARRGSCGREPRERPPHRRHSSSRPPSTPSPSRAASRVPSMRSSPRSSSHSIGFGVVMVYSASAVQATVQYHDPQFFLKRQVVYAGGGPRWRCGPRAGSTTTASTSSPTRSSSSSGGCCCSASSASGTPAAVPRAGSRSAPCTCSPPRWRRSRSSSGSRTRSPRRPSASRRSRVGFLPHLIVAGVFMLLCMKQPDFGSAVVLLLLTFTMLFVAGAKVGYILGASILGGALRRRGHPLPRVPLRAVPGVAPHGPAPAGPRVPAVPERHVVRLGRSRRASASGAASRRSTCPKRTPTSSPPSSARSWASSASRRSARPTCCLVARGVRAALRAPDDFGSFLAFGLSTMFGVQALVNLSVALAILPTKGLTLPFVSFGGSSLLVNAVAAGILLNISRQSGEPAAGDPAHRPAGLRGAAAPGTPTPSSRRPS